MAVTDNQPINVGNVKALFGALAELTMGGGFLDTFLCLTKVNQFSNLYLFQSNKVQAKQETSGDYRNYYRISFDNPGVYEISGTKYGSEINLYEIVFPDNSVVTQTAGNFDYRFMVNAGQFMYLYPPAKDEYLSKILIKRLC